MNVKANHSGDHSDSPKQPKHKRLTPMKAIQLKVRDLNCGNKDAVRIGSVKNPMDVPRILRPYRHGRKPREEERTEYGPDSEYGEIKPPLKAIKEYCLVDCSNDSSKEVKNCSCTDCPLHEFRQGKNPAMNRSGAKPPGERFSSKPPGQSSLLNASTSSEGQSDPCLEEKEYVPVCRERKTETKHSPQSPPNDSRYARHGQDSDEQPQPKGKARDDPTSDKARHSHSRKASGQKRCSAPPGDGKVSKAHRMVRRDK